MIFVVYIWKIAFVGLSVCKQATISTSKYGASAVKYARIFVPSFTSILPFDEI
jgi:hypothetical protein